MNLQLIPNCIDFDYTEKYLNDQSRGKFALYVGWVIPSKGIKDLVAAWQNDSPSGWTLKVVGPYIEGYPNMLAKKYSAGSIEFFGHLPHEQIMELVSRCGVFVFPSH